MQDQKRPKLSDIQIKLFPKHMKKSLESKQAFNLSQDSSKIYECISRDANKIRKRIAD